MRDNAHRKEVAWFVDPPYTVAGKRLYVQVMKTPVYGPGDRVVGVQGIFWDVTERKLAEQELERKNRLLEEAVESGILREEQAGAGRVGRYRFAHDLMRDVVYTELGAAWRQVLPAA